MINKIGPSYDAKGQIIPRSILGRPEWFLRNNSLNKFMNQQSMGPRQRFNSKNFTDNISSRSKMKLNSPSKANRPEITVTKQQCESDLEAIRQRVMENQRKEQLTLRSLPLD